MLYKRLFPRIIARAAHAKPQRMPARASKPLKSIVLPKFATVSNLATLLQVRFVDLQQRMQDMGYSDTDPDHIVDDENAQLIADEFGIEGQVSQSHGDDVYAQPPPENLAACPERPPVIALMGHVDHGKTTLLDYFRSSQIVKGEKGGITQHIGAFMTNLRQTNRQVCFLDTPGHEAFLKLRQRGANLTDIVLLVVAADDSVMPQTKEAIKHAKAAGVPMLVAITKIDRPEANIEKVTADLAAADVDVEDYGGETQTIPVSAVTKQGVDDLETALTALIEVIDARAPKDGNVEGVIVESQKLKGLGLTTSMIVRRGTLKPKMPLVAGTAHCHVRQIFNENNKALKEAPPGTPVRITGWQDLPEPGDTVLQASSEDMAKRVVANRKRLIQEALEAKQVEIINENRRIEHMMAKEAKEKAERLSLGLSVDEKETVSQQKTCSYIVKADVSGSAEAIADCVKDLRNDQVAADVLFTGVGAVTENDVFRAQAAGATILAFTTQVPRPIQRIAEQQKVPIRNYDVIYKLLGDISEDLSNLLPPVITRKVIGSAEIRQVFKITVKKSHILVAGIKVIKGSFNLRTLVQVVRDGEVIHSGVLSSIRHGKDQVAEAHKGSEYGVGFDNWDKFEEGDVIEAYEEIKTKQYL